MPRPLDLCARVIFRLLCTEFWKRTQSGDSPSVCPSVCFTNETVERRAVQFGIEILTENCHRNELIFVHVKPIALIHIFVAAINEHVLQSLSKITLCLYGSLHCGYTIRRKILYILCFRTRCPRTCGYPRDALKSPLIEYIQVFPGLSFIVIAVRKIIIFAISFYIDFFLPFEFLSCL